MGTAGYSTTVKRPGTAVAFTDLAMEWASGVSVGKQGYGATFGNGLWLIACAGGYVLRSVGGAVWAIATPLSAGSDVRGVAYGAGVFVAVGLAGKISTSTDGETWATRTSGTANALYDVTFGGSLFVAVGASGTILTSPDGITWTSRTSGTANALNRVAYAASTYVAVGAGGTILTSTNATSWTVRTSGTSNALGGIAYSSSQWCAVGVSGTVRTSTTGSTWAAGGTSPLTTAQLFEAVDMGGLLVVGSTAGRVILSTDGGTTWDGAVGIGLSYDVSAIATDGTSVVVAGTGGFIAHGDGRIFDIVGPWYKMTDRTKAVWNRTVLPTFKDGGSSIGSANIIRRDYVFGRVLLDPAPSSSVTVSGSYLPMQHVAGAHAYKLGLSTALYDDTDFQKGASGFRSRMPGLRDAALTVEHWDQLSQEFRDAVKNGTELLVEVRPGGANDFFRGWFVAEGVNDAGGVDDLESDTPSLVFAGNDASDLLLGFGD